MSSMRIFRFGTVALLLGIWAFLLSNAVAVVCILPTCRQSVALSHANVNGVITHCSNYDPWLVNTGGWWAAANEGNVVVKEIAVKVVNCYDWTEICTQPTQAVGKEQEVICTEHVVWSCQKQAGATTVKCSNPV